jgi:hypothetical protein
MQESSERASTKRRIRLQWWVEPSVRAAFRCCSAQRQQPPTPGGVAPSQGSQAGTPLWPHEHGKYGVWAGCRPPTPAPLQLPATAAAAAHAAQQRPAAALRQSS